MKLKIIKGYSDGELDRFIDDGDMLENVSPERAMVLINNHVAEIVEIKENNSESSQVKKLEIEINEKDEEIMELKKTVDEKQETIDKMNVILNEKDEEITKLKKASK